MQQPVYGRPSRYGEPDPSMRDIMSWPQDADAVPPPPPPARHIRTPQPPADQDRWETESMSMSRAVRSTDPTIPLWCVDSGRGQEVGAYSAAYPQPTPPEQPQGHIVPVCAPQQQYAPQRYAPQPQQQQCQQAPAAAPAPAPVPAAAPVQPPQAQALPAQAPVRPSRSQSMFVEAPQSDSDTDAPPQPRRKPKAKKAKAKPPKKAVAVARKGAPAVAAPKQARPKVGLQRAAAGSPGERRSAYHRKKKSTVESKQKIARRKAKQREDKQIASRSTRPSLPDSSFLTLFNKPPFYNYGHANVEPLRGGVCYGGYLLSHNVGPHTAPNHPESRQVFFNAELAANSRNESKLRSPLHSHRTQRTVECIPENVALNPMNHYDSFDELSSSDEEEVDMAIPAQRSAPPPARRRPQPPQQPQYNNYYSEGEEEEEEGEEQQQQQYAQQCAQQEEDAFSVEQESVGSWVDVRLPVAAPLPPQAPVQQLARQQAPVRFATKCPGGTQTCVPSHDPHAYYGAGTNATAYIRPAGRTESRGESVMDCLNGWA